MLWNVKMNRPRWNRATNVALVVVLVALLSMLFPQFVAASTNLSVRVSQSSDDAEESLGGGYDGYMDLTSTDLELIYEAEFSLNQEVGLRFQNMTIPPGAAINKAYIQFTADEIDSGTTNLTIYGEDIDNAPTFTNGASSYNISARTKTSTSVDWTNVPAWTSIGDAGLDQRTPDISPIIQEIVDRTGWSNGNSLVVIITGSGARVAEAYDGIAGSAPLLVVDYMEQAGNFNERIIKGDFNAARHVYATDVDGDGDIDVLGVAFDDNDITWWENNGSQNFTEHTIEGNFTGARYVYATDVDGDGDIDVLGAAYYANDITWWENNGSEVFTEHTIDGDFTGANSAYAIDIDGDGDIDVLGTAEIADDITWWENDHTKANNDPTKFTEHTIDGTFNGASSAYAIDVDGDGDIDVLGTAYVADDITWWENDGAQNFTERTIEGDFNSANSVYAIDVDGDGDIDVLGSAGVADDITWWENDHTKANNDPTKFTEHTIQGDFDGTRSAYAIDVDGDGDIDVLGAAVYADDITWWENTTTKVATRSFTERTIKGDFDTALSVYAIDVDCDGDIDVLGAALDADDITWWENDGSQNFTERIIKGDYNGARSVYATDVDGDGDIDVLGTAYYADDITWWENDGSQNFTERTIKGDYNGANSAYATDVDGDGDIDILGTAEDADDITWWENDGSEVFTEHIIDGTYNGAKSVYAIDVDGDGDIDVLGAAVYADDITWWENDGSENFTEHIIKGNFDGARTVYATDVDGDGDIDILGAASVADDITWWENDGSENFTERTIDGDFDGARVAYGIDIDGDGDIDVLGAAANADDITWWENDGSQNFTKRTIDGDFDNANFIYATDVDGDGDIDVLGTAGNADDITWWENTKLTILDWESYSDSGYSIVSDYFDDFATEHIVYMYGTEFATSTQYRVVFWDGAGAKAQTEDTTSDTSGELSAAHEFAAGSDTAGNWHATVYDSITYSPTSYDSNDSYLAADDTTYTGGYAFYAAEAAIPEFPTIIAGVVVVGMCFGIYYWMRKRRQAYVHAQT